MHDVFISYSSKDKKIADAIVHILEANRIRCWIAPRDIIPGQSYPEAIADSIETTKVFVLVFSINSNESRQVQNEMTLALSAEKIIIPFKIDNTQPNKTFKYIFGSSHWLDALSKDLESCIYYLMEGIKRLLEPTEPKKHINPKENFSGGSDKLRIATYAELVHLGQTSLDIAKRLEENDLNNYPGMTREQEGTSEQWAEYLENYPDTFRFLVNKEHEIVGAWYTLALTDNQYKKILQGEFNETDFFIDKTECLMFEGIYKGFILDISINKQYRDMKANKMLVNSFIKQIESYAKEGIFFSDWVVNVFTKEHIPLYKSMGFSEVCPHKVFGTIYHLKFTPLPELSIYAKYEEMRRLYDNLGN